MDREQNRNNRNNEADGSVPGWIKVLGAVAGIGLGVGALIGVISLATRQNEVRNQEENQHSEEDDSEDADVIRRSLSVRTFEIAEPQGSRVEIVPDRPNISNINSLLDDIYVRYVGLRKEVFKTYYDIFYKIFSKLHRNMKDADAYYRHYSMAVEHAGSHYDKLRIKKPDEFDMDVVIGLPLCFRENPRNPENSDIIIETQDPGFVQLKMGQQFLNLPNRSDWATNKTAFKWGELGYLQRSKFISWFQGVVIKALNLFDSDIFGKHVYVIDDEEYVIKTSASGPAITLKISNSSGFKIDVDLVPVLRFPEERWPPGPEYIPIPDRLRNSYWHVAPKPNKKYLCNSVEQARSWRISLHCQERKLLYNSFNLRKAIMLVKKLRDSQQMCKVVSYYIKTLAFWVVVECNDPNIGQNSPAKIFALLVDKFIKACETGRIDYFWHPCNNLLDGVKKATLENYAVRLRNLRKILNSPKDYKKVAKYMLTEEEYEEYEGFLYN